VKKSLTVLAGMVVVLLTSSVPALAQQGQEAPQSDNATLTFELTVEGNPPADATFFGNVRLGEGGPGVFVPLTDPDGDGFYTGSATVPRFLPGPRPLPPGVEPVSLQVLIVQGTGQVSIPAGALRPGEPTRVIEDFGFVRIEDRTLSASVSFPSNGGGPARELPKSGGMVSASLLSLGALLLVGCGLLVRRATR
jgi:LPXTG-motif cell wall-anchored protein